MNFTKRLREPVQRGEITCSVRIWMRPKVTAGKRYRMGDGELAVDSIHQIELADITPELARESGFKSVIDLLKTAKHGPGSNVYLVHFRYLPPGKRGDASKAKARAEKPKTRGRKLDSARQRKRLATLLARLPEAVAVAVASRSHLSLEVRKKRFGYFLHDHHGDGRIAVNCKSSDGVRDALQQLAPEAFHIPKYLGNKGWVGLWLDGAKPPWPAVELALEEAYRLVAPKTLRARAGAD
jgi:hypothetical protein